MRDGVRLIFPIGQCGGRAGGSNGAPVHYQIRVGARTFALPTERFIAWVATHGSPTQPEGTQWTFEAAARGLTGFGVHNANGLLAQLRDDGLVDEVDPTDGLGFAGRYRLVPLLLGLGNSPQAAGTYTVGLVDQPMVEMSRAVNAIWEWADTAADIWSACQRFAEQERSYGSPNIALLDPERVLAHLLTSLHRLLVVSAAYLEPAHPQEGHR